MQQSADQRSAKSNIHPSRTTGNISVSTVDNSLWKQLLVRGNAFRNVFKDAESVNKAALALSIDCLIWIFCCETELELGENPITLTQRVHFHRTWDNLTIIFVSEVSLSSKPKKLFHQTVTILGIVAYKIERVLSTYFTLIFFLYFVRRS